MDHQYEHLYQQVMSFSVDEPAAHLSFPDRLAAENGWSSDYARRVFEEYKKFAFLAVAAGHPVTPSNQVDQAWHLHLTYTRSYWERFCGEVLDRTLHHDPNTGGPAAQAKFMNWYEHMLASYRRLFHQEPPADIWPDTRTRFGPDLLHRCVNTARNWIITKPRLPWAIIAVTGVSLIVLLAARIFANRRHVGESDTSVAMLGQFNLPALAFPVLVAIFVAALCMAGFIRGWLKRGAVSTWFLCRRPPATILAMVGPVLGAGGIETFTF